MKNIIKTLYYLKKYKNIKTIYADMVIGFICDIDELTYMIDCKLIRPLYNYNAHIDMKIMTISITTKGLQLIKIDMIDNICDEENFHKISTEL